MSPGAGRVLRALLVGIAVSVTVTGLSRVGVLAGWGTALGERQPISRRYLAELRGRAQPVEVFELLPAAAGAGGGHE